MMPQYDYKIVDIPIDDFSHQLNKFGLDGWELILANKEIYTANIYEWSTGAPQYATYFHCIFKKQLCAEFPVV